MRRAPLEPVATPPALLGVLSHPQESKQKAFGSFWVLRAVGTVQGSAPAAAVTPLASEGLRGGPCVCTRLPVLRGAASPPSSAAAPPPLVSVTSVLGTRGRSGAETEHKRVAGGSASSSSRGIKRRGVQVAGESQPRDEEGLTCLVTHEQISVTDRSGQ